MARSFAVRGRSALRQGQRRQTLWIAGSWTNNTVAADAAVLLTSLNAAALALRPFTIVRTRGVLYVSTDQAGSTENQSLIYGETVVTDQASAIGITAVPTPETDNGSDFHVMEPLASRFFLNSAIGSGEGLAGGIMHTFDSKAMRKVDLGEDLISVVEVGASGISEGVIFRTFARVLVKLH